MVSQFRRNAGQGFPKDTTWMQCKKVNENWTQPSDNFIGLPVGELCPRNPQARDVRGTKQRLNGFVVRAASNLLNQHAGDYVTRVCVVICGSRFGLERKTRGPAEQLAASGDTGDAQIRSAAFQ